MTPGYRCIIVVPTLNEEAFIGPLLDQLLAEAPSIDALVVVADGGSTDGTCVIVSAVAARSDTVRLLSNPKRLQSAGINLAVEQFGAGATYLLRIDAHATYPGSYCRPLVEEADRIGAESIVVSMRTEGAQGFQMAVATAQNGLLGTGGAAHRMGSTGRWVDHGHHALMRLDAFRAVGGYDESFSHNEDAELDHRIRSRGGRIWMTAATQMIYYPRSTVRGLWKQYVGYGGGRARNLCKHRTLPKVRQGLPILVGPAILLALFSPLDRAALLPAALWVMSCVAAGLVGFARTRRVDSLAATYAAMVMHAAWSFGFWRYLLRDPPAARGAQVRTGPMHCGVQGGMDRITIAICTFRRSHLADTLRSLGDLDIPKGCTLDIVVADNDYEPSATHLVQDIQTTHPIAIRYLHAPAANISLARNACLENAGGRYVAFIDDDELATPVWLTALVEASRELDADVVLGPVRAIYGPDAPAWMRNGDFHSTIPVYVGGEIITGYTCNALLDLSKASLRNLRFDPARGRTGGEDTAFFHEVTARGGRIAFSPDAEVSEAVPADRATLAWLARRRLRMGRTHGQIVAQGRGQASRALQAGLAASKFAACLLLVACFAADPVKRRRNQLRATLHAGAVGGILGVKPAALYGVASRSKDSHAA